MVEKKILGVCKWLSIKFELDITGIRLIFVFATIIGFGSPIFLYLILYLIMPKSAS